MKVAERTREAIDGKILKFWEKTLMAGIPITKRGWVEGDEIVKEKQFFRESTKDSSLDPSGKMTQGFLKFLREKGFEKEGMTHKASIYSSDFGMAKPTRAIVRTLGPRKITVGDKETTAYETEIEMIASRINEDDKLAGQGIAVRTKMKMGGLAIDIGKPRKNWPRWRNPRKRTFFSTPENYLAGLRNSQECKEKAFFVSSPRMEKLADITYKEIRKKVRRIDEQTLEIGTARRLEAH